MKSKQLLKLTKEKLVEKLDKAREELSNLKFEVKMGQSQDYASIKKQRKDVARMMTILNDGEVSNKIEVEAKVIKKVVTKKEKDNSKKLTSKSKNGVVESDKSKKESK